MEYTGTKNSIWSHVGVGDGKSFARSLLTVRAACVFGKRGDGLEV